MQDLRARDILLEAQLKAAVDEHEQLRQTLRTTAAHASQRAQGGEHLALVKAIESRISAIDTDKARAETQLAMVRGDIQQLEENLDAERRYLREAEEKWAHDEQRRSQEESERQARSAEASERIRRQEAALVIRSDERARMMLAWREEERELRVER